MTDPGREDEPKDEPDVDEADVPEVEREPTTDTVDEEEARATDAALAEEDTTDPGIRRGRYALIGTVLIAAALIVYWAYFGPEKGGSCPTTMVPRFSSQQLQQQERVAARRARRIEVRIRRVRSASQRRTLRKREVTRRAWERLRLYQARSQKKPFRVGDLNPGSRPRWRLVRTTGAQVTIAIGDNTERARRGWGAVRVRRIGRGRQRALPRTAKVGSFLREGSARRTDTWLQFEPSTQANRQPDGTLVKFSVCAGRPDDPEENHAGAYRGAVRIAGRQMRGVNVPVVITVKWDRRIAVTMAVLIALAGALIAMGNSKSADVKVEEVAENQRLHELLWALPIIGSFAAGCAAGIFIYLSDATWGADFSDLTKLGAAALAGGAVAGTGLAPVGRSARRKAATRTAANEAATVAGRALLRRKNAARKRARARKWRTRLAWVRRIRR